MRAVLTGLTCFWSSPGTSFADSYSLVLALGSVLAKQHFEMAVLVRYKAVSAVLERNPNKNSSSKLL